jgi:manganese-dependent inorganic pyrophosphatase
VQEPSPDVLPEIYVIGHRNPDTDSIAAAIGYAELKGKQDEAHRYVACRLGALNPQTTWALEQAEIEAPPLLEHVSVRVCDAMRTDFPKASVDESVRDAGQLMVHENLELLPVVDGDGVLAGVLTEEALARRYVRESRGASRLAEPTAVREIMDGLAGELLCGDPEHLVTGRVWVLAMATATMLSGVAEGDVVVVGDRPDAQRRAVDAGVGAIVLSNGVEPGDGICAAAEAAGTPVIRTSLDSYVAGRMITLSTPCSSLIDREPLTSRDDALLEDVAGDVVDVSYRGLVVVDAAHRPIGLLTRNELVDPQPRRVILVDHAEQAQSVPGVGEAEIVEILDHHHIGSIETTLPVVATFDPVGSTATLVTERFGAAGIAPTRPAAVMLLSAVLSDTVILSSPTTTDRDRRMAERLGDQLGLDVRAFGQQLFRAGSDIAAVDADVLVARDAKAYDAGGSELCIAQLELVGSDALNGKLEELRAAAAKRRDEGGFRLFALMLTDVLAGDTQLLVAGDHALAERAFGKPAVDGLIELPGVMSRKKQVAPKLLAAA